MFENLAEKSDDKLDLKKSRGGVADIEFIVQMLVWSNAHQCNELTEHPDNVRLSESARSLGLISDEMKRSLISAYIKYRELYHLKSLNNEEKTVQHSFVKLNKDEVSKVWQHLFN